MLNTVQAASRLLIRVSIAAFTVIVLLLIQSAFWSNRVSLWMQLIILATALLSYFRPRYSLLLLAAIVPLGQIGSRTLNSNMRGAEALVLAFLAGALVRGWTLRQFRSFPSTRLETAALVFGLVVAASCIEQLWFLQIQRDFPGRSSKASSDTRVERYIATWQGFGMIFFAMLLLEGLALLLFTERYTPRSGGFASAGLSFMLMAGAVGTALLTIAVAAASFAIAPTQTAISRILSVKGWSVHIGDVNAAGSFFAMMMFIALGIALKRSDAPRALARCRGFLLCATLMTVPEPRWRRLACSVLVCRSIAFARRSDHRRADMARIAAVLAMRRQSSTGRRCGRHAPARSLRKQSRVRTGFSRNHMATCCGGAAFGVGIGQYYLWSRRFAAA